MAETVKSFVQFVMDHSNDPVVVMKARFAMDRELTSARSRKDAAVCDHCGHFFDKKDERCCLPGDGDQWGPCCPACTLMRLHGSEAWAVWNSCNGPFTHTIGSKEHADECLAESGREAAGDQVVPVRIYVEPEEQWPGREWSHQNYGV